MIVKLVTKAQVVTTRVLPDGEFELVLNVAHGDVADLFSVSGEPEDFEKTDALCGAFLGVGNRGGFSVCSMGRRGR